MELIVGHGVVFAHDSAELLPGNDFTERHGKPGFARRPTSVNFTALLEDGRALVDVATISEVRQCHRILEVSIRCDSGRLVVSSEDPGGMVAWEGRPGWIRVSLGQSLDEADVLRIRVHVSESSNDAESVVVEGGIQLPTPFLETAEVARF